ncbi:MAG TPA: RagB/SusD family nutrient uptake outer membrane protein, partial [Chryseolinea sp.]|nr:RagB/SusD family nutrient uptake outer membrane protein [Chryseolinea sp.]
MKILKFLFIYCILFATSISACNEATIDLDPIGNTEASFFQNEAQMTEAVFGTYAKLSYFYKRGGSGDDNLQSIWLLPSDDLTTPGATSTEIFSTLEGDDGELSRYFNFSYQIIARANIVMEKIIENGSLAYEETSNADEYHRGEALFLRSLMYFNLWNIFGTAPLVTERITSLDDAYPANSTGTELLDQAIIDLTEAATLLPEAWDEENLGRATKNSAR